MFTQPVQFVAEHADDSRSWKSRRRPNDMASLMQSTHTSSSTDKVSTAVRTPLLPKAEEPTTLNEVHRMMIVAVD